LKLEKNRKLKKLFIIILMVTACISAMAQQNVKISGRVTDFEGKPISHCAVMLMDKLFHAVDSVSTDSAGYYLINNVKPGRYLALTADGLYTTYECYRGNEIR
jgi:hypothetical protein